MTAVDIRCCQRLVVLGEAPSQLADHLLERTAGHLEPAEDASSGCANYADEDGQPNHEYTNAVPTASGSFFLASDDAGHFGATVHFAPLLAHSQVAYQNVVRPIP